MKKTLIIGAICLGVLIIFLAITLKINSQNKNLEGVVYDCEANQLIANANITVPKPMSFLEAITFQWGGGKNYFATTDQSGKFTMPYTNNTFNSRTSKNGYLDAVDYGNTGNIRIGLLKRQPADSISEYSRRCKKSYECIETKVINNVITTRDICGQLQ